MMASRLLSILMLLQTRGRMSAAALAAEFEVSIRTIHRDIDQLSAAGVPVYADRGRTGGFQLMDGYRTRLTGLTQAEAETLFLAGLPGPAAELGLSAALSAARLKLKAALPAQMAPEAERIASRFHLDPRGWFRGAEPLAALQPVAQAVWAEKRLRLAYGRGGRVMELDPLGLVLKGGVWYLVARAGTAIRTYRVAVIREAEMQDEVVRRPRDFDLAAHWEAASQAYEAGLYRDQARVRLSPRGIGLLHLLGAPVEAAARASLEPPDQAGWRTCIFPIESVEDGVREIMRLGPDVEVLGPPDLREALTAALAEACALYGVSR